MRRITLLPAIIYIVTAQMTFTDNWDKRSLSNLFRGWQQDDLMVNRACSWDTIAEITRELKQIYKNKTN